MPGDMLEDRGGTLETLKSRLNQPGSGQNGQFRKNGLGVDLWGRNIQKPRPPKHRQHPDRPDFNEAIRLGVFGTRRRNVRWRLFKPGIATANHAKEILFAYFA